MSDASPWAKGEKPAGNLWDLTRRWFLFLSTCRRQAQALPADPEWMRGKLEDLLAEMERKAAADPRIEAALGEATYPLVYLADEILLTCGWAGEAAWAADLFETRKFGTQHAGLDFFTRLDQALSSDKQDLLQVFFQCLCLGFKGKLIKQPEAIHNLRRDLYRRLPAERITGTRLCPEAYEHTDRRTFVKLPVVAAARTVVALVAFLVAILIVANITFESRLSELNETAEKYLQSSPAADTEDG
jgi:type IV/VI secretion system ImpK/VasF family protein